jgi:hypothetical protein
MYFKLEDIHLLGYDAEYSVEFQPACYLVFAEIISSTLKMEAICSSETSVETRRNTLCHITEDDTLRNHRCENLKSYFKLA